MACEDIESTKYALLHIRTQKNNPFISK